MLDEAVQQRSKSIQRTQVREALKDALVIRIRSRNILQPRFLNVLRGFPPEVRRMPEVVRSYKEEADLEG